VTQSAADRKPLALALVVLAAAVIVAVVVGVNWWGRHTDHERAAARDAAVDGARQAIVDTQTFNTSDIPGTLNRIRGAMTGDLLKNWDDRDRAFTEDRLNERRDDRFRTEPIVVASAPTEFDASEQTAKVLVYLVQKFYTAEKPSDDGYRWTYMVTMTETDGRWKASAMVPLQEGGIVGSADPSKPVGAAPGSSSVPQAPPAPAPSDNPPAPTEGGTP